MFVLLNHSVKQELGEALWGSRSGPCPGSESRILILAPSWTSHEYESLISSSAKWRQNPCPPYSQGCWTKRIMCMLHFENGTVLHKNKALIIQGHHVFLWGSGNVCSLVEKVFNHLLCCRDCTSQELPHEGEVWGSGNGPKGGGSVSICHRLKMSARDKLVTMVLATLEGLPHEEGMVCMS